MSPETMTIDELARTYHRIMSPEWLELFDSPDESIRASAYQARFAAIDVAKFFGLAS